MESKNQKNNVGPDTKIVYPKNPFGPNLGATPEQLDELSAFAQKYTEEQKNEAAQTERMLDEKRAVLRGYAAQLLKLWQSMELDSEMALDQHDGTFLIIHKSNNGIRMGVARRHDVHLTGYLPNSSDFMVFQDGVLDTRGKTPIVKSIYFFDQDALHKTEISSGYTYHGVSKQAHFTEEDLQSPTRLEESYQTAQIMLHVPRL